MLFRAYGVTVSLAHLKPGEGAPRHTHKEGEHSLYVAEGTVEQLGATQREVGPETLIVFPVNEEHGFIAKTDALVVSIHRTEDFPLLKEE